MKKYWKYLIAAAAIAVSAPSFTACSDNDEVDPYSINYIYMRQPNDTYANVEYKFNGEFLSGLEDPLALVPVRLTKPAPCDINIEVAIDPTLVDEYNEANDGDYVFLEGAEVLNPKLTIKKGEYLSDVITLGFTDHSGFFDKTENLILPVVVKSATGGVTISKSSRIFLTFNSSYRANLLKLTSDLSIFTNIKEAGWQTAYTNYTFTDFLRAEWAVDDAVKVNLAIDNSLVATYNTNNGTSYQALPGTTLGATTLEIPVGEISADLNIKLGDYTGVADGEEYMIPVKISFVSGDGAVLPEAFQVAYIEVTATLRAVTCETSLPAGLTQFIGTNWSGVTGSEWGDQDFTEVLDHEVSYFWFYPGYTTTVDLGEVQNISAVGMQWYAWYYKLVNLNNVETSQDGLTWLQWGNMEQSQAASSASTFYMVFSKPAKMRYLRFVNGDDAYGWDAALQYMTIWK